MTHQMTLVDVARSKAAVRAASEACPLFGEDAEYFPEGVLGPRARPLGPARPNPAKMPAQVVADVGADYVVAW